MSASTGDKKNADTVVAGQFDARLVFDDTRYTSLSVTIDGEKVPVRWYKEVCYVAQPIPIKERVGAGTPVNILNPECGFQSMNIFVPERVAAGQENAIFMSFSNRGWYSSYVASSVKDGDKLSSESSHVAAALKAGYVFVDVGTRSRGLTALDGRYPGKAPAVVVDAKAAIRYLRLNDRLMPGSAERIVTHGTSGGGALVSIVGASGNSKDYLPYLKEVGAAGVTTQGESLLRDDVLAVVSYCPITDLGNADLAYEWLYTVLNTREASGQNPNPAGSRELAAQFAAYQASLGLKDDQGRALNAESMLEAIQREVIRSAEMFMSQGGSIPEFGQTWEDKTVNDWIHVDATARKVTNIDMARYLRYVVGKRALKNAPAFDQKGLKVTGGQGESNLFGTEQQLYSNFTEYAWNHNNEAGDGMGRDDTKLSWAQYLAGAEGKRVVEQLKLINPMNYIGTADTASNWYLRHGTLDRDTAFTIPLNLSRALRADSKVKDLNFRLSWHMGHGGNYDVPEMMGWVAEKVKREKGV